MTVPGPKPTPPGYGGNATWTNPAWQTRRLLDEVRVAALANAVEVWQAGYVDPDGDQIERIIATARTFEAYLTGEEANDPS